MFAALFGFFGVLVGGILTHLFAVSNEWRNRRMEAMVASVSACIRVLSAHERIFDILQGGDAPPLTDDRVVRALTERNRALTEWRVARARLEIVVSDDERLKQAIGRFNTAYGEADRWVSTYLKKGEDFRFGDFAEVDHIIWEEMRAARDEIITRCQVRSRQDARWRERIRLAFFNRSDDTEQVLSQTHPDTLTFRSNLASAYQAAGRLDEAERLLNPSKPGS